MALIQSGLSTNLATVDSTGNLYTTIYPNVGVGAYQWTAVSGTIAASTAANSILFTMKNNGTNLVVIRRISVGMQVTTAYTKGSLRLSTYFVRTAFTQGTTNGTLVTLTGNNGKKRTSHPTTNVVGYICTTTGITGDVATGEDGTPLTTANLDLPATIGNIPLTGLQDIIVHTDTEYPIILVPQEGLRLKNDTAFAATGSGNLIVNVEYGEVASYS